MSQLQIPIRSAFRSFRSAGRINFKSEVQGSFTFILQFWFSYVDQ